MTWPASDVVTTNLDAGTDSASTARGNLLDLAQKFNQLRGHVSAFMQTLLTRVDAAAVRSDLALANHQLLTVDGTGNASVPATLTAGVLSSAGGMSAAGVVVAGGGLSAGSSCGITGNLSVSGSINAGDNITAYSDERLKENWGEIDPEFVHFLAQVRAGTFQRKDGDGRRFAGVSAQSLQQLLPETVEVDQHGLLSVAYGNAALVACVALAREVQALRSDLARLKGGA